MITFQNTPLAPRLHQLKQPVQGPELACWRLATSGSKLGSSRVDTAAAVSSLQSCGRRCTDSRTCSSFAFSTSGYTNCQLSSREAESLGARDLVRTGLAFMTRELTDPDWPFRLEN